MSRVEELREQIANEQSAEVAQQTVLWRLGVAIHRIERRDELVSLLESELASAKASLAKKNAALREIAENFFGAEKGEVGCDPKIMAESFQRRIAIARAALADGDGE